MDRINEERKEWEERVRIKRTERSLRSKQKKRNRNRASLSKKYYSHHETVQESYGRGKKARRLLLVVPERLELYEHHDEAMEFIREFRRVALAERRPVRLDFSNTKYIGPAASLVLVAEVYRCMQIAQDRVIGTYPKDKELERMLQDTGFFDLLDVASRLPTTEKKGPLEYIKFQTGTRALGPDAYHLEQALLGEERKLDKGASAKLYRGITEAMTNVVQHAYMDLRKEPIPRLHNQWWMVGHIDRDKQDLMVMFFDQGVGIPATLPFKHANEVIAAALVKFNIIKSQDGELILAAMELGRSRTDLSHQGRGLNDLRAFIDKSGAGSLKILSRNGEYTYSSSKQETTKNHRLSLGGTLIQWTVNLPSVLAQQNLD